MTTETKTVLTTPALVKVIPPGGPEPQQSTTGMLSLLEDNTVQFTDEHNKILWTLNESDIKVIDFNYRLSISTGFRIEDTSGNCYAILLDGLTKSFSDFLKIGFRVHGYEMRQKQMYGVESHYLWQ